MDIAIYEGEVLLVCCEVKYLIRHQPRYLSAIAIGMRLGFSVEYADNNGFRLQKDVVPLG